MALGWGVFKPELNQNEANTAASWGRRCAFLIVQRFGLRFRRPCS